MATQWSHQPTRVEVMKTFKQILTELKPHTLRSYLKKTQADKDNHYQGRKLATRGLLKNMKHSTVQGHFHRLYNQAPHEHNMDADEVKAHLANKGHKWWAGRKIHSPTGGVKEEKVIAEGKYTGFNAEHPAHVAAEGSEYHPDHPFSEQITKKTVKQLLEGKTATGQPANKIDTTPRLTLGKRLKYTRGAGNGQGNGNDNRRL